MKKVNFQEGFYYSGGYGLPLLLIIIGFYFLAKNLGWIKQEISIWPILMILFGSYLILKRIRKTNTF